MTPSKPLTPTELGAAIHASPMAQCDDQEDEQARRNGMKGWCERFAATLAATQAVEPGLREAAQAVVDEGEIRVMDGDGSIGVRQLSKNSTTIQRLRAALAARSSSAPAELEAFNAVVAQHEPDIETNSDYDFMSMWMTCSCGWDQDRDRVRNEYVEWADHVRAALAARLTSSPENPA